MVTMHNTQLVLMQAIVAGLLLAPLITVVAYLPQQPHVLLPEAFRTRTTTTRTNPFHQQGLDVALPDFDVFFGRVQQVSPLAKTVIQKSQQQHKHSNRHTHHPAAFGVAMDGPTVDRTLEDPKLKWKRIDSHSKGLTIDKIDHFNGKPAPLLRFRCRLQGPCVGEPFGRYIMDLEQRQKWDDQIAQVYEAYPISDLDAANIAMGFGRYGDCSRLGVGYALTKAGIISPREQLFLYGLQDFTDGSCVIWGTEMDESYNYLMPGASAATDAVDTVSNNKQHQPHHHHQHHHQQHHRHATRAKSHLFAMTLTPVDDDHFDLEYVMQLEIGGNLPQFVTTPVMIDTVKALLRVATKEYAQMEIVKRAVPAGLGEEGEHSHDHAIMANRDSLLLAH